MFPGSLVLLCGFFAILHAWLNAFAEMMRFADRMFYKVRGRVSVCLCNARKFISFLIYKFRPQRYPGYNRRGVKVKYKPFFLVCIGKGRLGYTYGRFEGYLKTYMATDEQLGY